MSFIKQKNKFTLLKHQLGFINKLNSKVVSKKPIFYPICALYYACIENVFKRKLSRQLKFFFLRFRNLIIKIIKVIGTKINQSRQE